MTNKINIFGQWPSQELLQGCLCNHAKSFLTNAEHRGGKRLGHRVKARSVQFNKPAECNATIYQKNMFGQGPGAKTRRTTQQSTKKLFWGSHILREQRAGSEAPGQTLQCQLRAALSDTTTFTKNIWARNNQQKSIFEGALYQAKQFNNSTIHKKYNMFNQTCQGQGSKRLSLELQA